MPKIEDSKLLSIEYSDGANYDQDKRMREPRDFLSAMLKDWGKCLQSSDDKYST
jgi:hypothetical protein